jgi:hypothetical protein
MITMQFIGMDLTLGIFLKPLAGLWKPLDFKRKAPRLFLFPSTIHSLFLPHNFLQAVKWIIATSYPQRDHQYSHVPLSD